VAYTTAAGLAPTTTTMLPADIGGLTFGAGVYKASSSVGITGAVTLDGMGNPDAVFVFQVTSTLITASGSSVVLINDANACNVYWQVGSSATLSTHTAFKGTIMALASITVQTNTTVEGRTLARTGAVTLDSDSITRPTCTCDPPTSLIDSSSAASTEISIALIALILSASMVLY